MGSSHSSFLVLTVLLVCRPFHTVAARNNCCLCGESSCGGAHQDQQYHYIDSDGYTCMEYEINVYKTYTKGDSSCVAAQESNRAFCCCNPSSTTSKYSICAEPAQNPRPAPAPVYGFTPGNEPFCSLCANGAFPQNPYTVLSIAYFGGSLSCQGLYEMGESGNGKPWRNATCLFPLSLDLPSRLSPINISFPHCV